MIKYEIKWVEDEGVWIATLTITSSEWERIEIGHGATPEHALSVVKDGAVCSLAMVIEELEKYRTGKRSVGG